MFLYEPREINLSQQPVLDSQIVTVLNRDNSPVLNATLLFNKHFAGADASVALSVSPSSLNNFTSTTMASTKVVSSLMNTVKTIDTPHHEIMLLVLLGIFTTISLTISLAVIVFCRKKNTVFMLQKCEQESDVELDDLPTEIENSDSETEEVRTILRVQRSESYPGLAKYTNSHKTEDSNCCLIRENGRLHSSSLIPLLKKADNLKGATISSNRKLNHGIKTTKSMHKSNTFSTPQECLNLIVSPHTQQAKDYSFGSISKSNMSTMTQRNYITIFAEREICLQDNNKAIDRNRLDNVVIDFHGKSDRDEGNESILTQDDNQLDFQGKLEIL